MPPTKVKVSCQDVTLKLTLNEQHMQKSLADAVLIPFLGAYNKRSKAEPLDLATGVRSIEIEGMAWDPSHCVNGAASKMLGSRSEPHVVILPYKIISKAQTPLAAPGPAVGNANGNPMDMLSSLLGAGAGGMPGGGGMADSGMDPAALLSSLGLDSADPAALSSMMQSVTHLLPPELKKRAESLTSEQTESMIRMSKPPSKPEIAYAGVDAAGSACKHVRSGPPVARSADAQSLRAGAALREARQRIAKLEDEERSALAAATAAVDAIVPGAMVAKMATIDGRLLVALDGALDESDVAAASFALEHRAAFRRKEQSVAERPEQKHGVTEHDASEFCATPLYARIASLLPLFFPDASYTPNRIYTNAMCFGDVAFMHRDSENRKATGGFVDNVTALLYPNQAWDTSYSGETVFFSEESDAREVVLPKPGRLIFFAASLQHVGRPPSRLFWGVRFTLAIKFVAARDRGPGDLSGGGGHAGLIGAGALPAVGCIDEVDGSDEEDGLMLESQPLSFEAAMKMANQLD